MTIAIFLVLILLSGYIANFSTHARFDLAKAFGFVLLETIFGILFFILSLFSLMWLGVLPILLNGIGSFFILILVIAMLGGFLLYWCQCLVFAKRLISGQVLTLAEYIIQWSLIYITVYQVLFDSLFSKETLETLVELQLSTPSDLMFLVLPSLISVWMAIILYKVKHNQI